MCQGQLTPKQKCFQQLLKLFAANVPTQGWRQSIPHEQMQTSNAKFLSSKLLCIHWTTHIGANSNNCQRRGWYIDEIRRCLARQRLLHQAWDLVLHSRWTGSQHNWCSISVKWSHCLACMMSLLSCEYVDKYFIRFSLQFTWTVMVQEPSHTLVTVGVAELTPVSLSALMQSIFKDVKPR